MFSCKFREICKNSLFIEHPLKTTSTNPNNNNNNNNNTPLQAFVNKMENRIPNKVKFGYFLQLLTKETEKSITKLVMERLPKIWIEWIKWIECSIKFLSPWWISYHYYNTSLYRVGALFWAGSNPVWVCIEDTWRCEISSNGLGMSNFVNITRPIYM